MSFLTFLASICISITLAGSSKTNIHANSPSSTAQPTTFHLHPNRPIRNGGFKIAFPLENDQVLLIPHDSQNGSEADKPLTFSQLKEEVEALKMIESASGLKTPLLAENFEPFEVSKDILVALGVDVETFEMKTKDRTVHVFQENGKVFGFLQKYIKGNVWTHKQLKMFFKSTASKIATIELSQTFRTTLGNDLKKFIEFVETFEIPDLQFFITPEGNIIVTDPNLAWGNIERIPSKNRADSFKDLLYIVETFFVPNSIEDFFTWIDIRTNIQEKQGEACNGPLLVDILVLEDNKIAQELSSIFESKVDFAKWNHPHYEEADEDWKADALTNYRVDHFMRHEGETKQVEKSGGPRKVTVTVKMLFEVKMSNGKTYTFCVEESKK